MNKKILKKGLLISAAAMTALAFAFDWPQEAISSDTFFSYFAQLRGGAFETSLIFRDNSTVKAAEDGVVAAIITEHNNDMGWFESPLGNAVILVHDDDFSTVYGNIDEESLNPELFDANSVETGMEFGISGNSGWQNGQSCLEFQVLDLKSGSSINPRNLMPHMGNELPLEIGRITIKNEEGTSWDLANTRIIPSGRYSIYMSRQSVAVPYRTKISLNGASIESIGYDRIKAEDGELCIYGNKAYSCSEIYPNEDRQLLGVLQLTKGKNTLSITIQDITGAEKKDSYNLDIY
ncbi:MAG: M23 family metallopeptidase [Treponema sp.]|nr:M23 family metallopeptidase [Treponema sp.]